MGNTEGKEGRDRNGASVHVGGPKRETQGKISGIIGLAPVFLTESSKKKWPLLKALWMAVHIFLKGQGIWPNFIALASETVELVKKM